MQYIPQITAPVVNINGAHADSLVQQHMAIVRALRDASMLMHAHFPHGRDFQTAPEGVYSVARKQATERCMTLEKLIMDYEALALAISEQRR